MEFACGNAAERNAPHAVFLCKLQAGTIAGRKQLFAPFCQPVADDRPYCVQYILEGKVIGWSDFCLPGWLLMALCPHKLRAGQTQLHARIGVDSIVNAAVAGDEAPQHPTVRRVDNGVAF